jgi:hypothetical protein
MSERTEFETWWWREDGAHVPRGMMGDGIQDVARKAWEAGRAAQNKFDFSELDVTHWPTASVEFEVHDDEVDGSSLAHALRQAAAFLDTEAKALPGRPGATMADSILFAQVSENHCASYGGSWKVNLLFQVPGQADFYAWWATVRERDGFDEALMTQFRSAFFAGQRLELEKNEKGGEGHDEAGG